MRISGGSTKRKLERLRREAAADRRKEERDHIRFKLDGLGFETLMVRCRGGKKDLNYWNAVMDVVQQDARESGLDLHPNARGFRDFFWSVRRLLNLDDVRYDVLPGGGNAYAFTSLREIEIERIVDEDTFATALHEAGHIATKCEPPRHQRVARNPKFPTIGTACIQCELGAWRQAIEWVVRDGWRSEYGRIVWSDRMHRHMTESLGTYARLATPVERDEIAQLCSRRTKLDALMRALQLESKGSLR